jgi:hypothetical protein
MRKLMMLVAAVGLAGCVTPYGPQGLMGGYSDSEESPGVFQVVVNGNGYTGRARLSAYYRRRVREVCAEYGGGVVEFTENFDNSGGKWSVWGFVTCSEPQK